MLIQDALTGRLHEIPDHMYGSYLGEYGQHYGPQWGEYPQGHGYTPQRVASQVVYDGLGNPVGMLPLLTALAPIAAQVLPQLAQKFLPGITKAITGFFHGAPPEAAGPMMDHQAGPTPGAHAPAPAPVQPPAPHMMGPIAHPMARFHHRHRCHCVRGHRHHHHHHHHPRHIAVPPPVFMEPIREAGNAEPAGPVQGFGDYGRW
ncbi:MAG TPA: hypothetical protein VIC84_10935 [Blastocatellia bacterium]|jgi:hypothetical protein